MLLSPTRFQRQVRLPVTLSFDGGREAGCRRALVVGGSVDLATGPALAHHGIPSLASATNMPFDSPRQFGRL